ncbi:MAG: ABC transporter permease [Bacteroidetes bacterium]|nr:ABC transporter permease [Bacteroidota bacterium]
MNTDLFIAHRMIKGSGGHYSRPVIRISILAIALSLTIMFVSIAILTGFQQEIRDKVIGFTGHIQVTRFSENTNLVPYPVEKQQPFLSALRAHPKIKNIQVYASKAGIIRTSDQIQGVVLKGVGEDYDWGFFRKRMARGNIPDYSDSAQKNDVIISLVLAKLLNLKINDPVRMYFIYGEHTVGRKFRIAGIFETGLEEFDRLYVIGNLVHIQKINGWNSGQIGGFEVVLKDFRDIEEMGKYVYHQIGFQLDASTIYQLYPQIFDWLALQDMNVVIILSLMIAVSAITMISTLLILILERTSMIGVLKALGLPNRRIRKIFVYHALYILGWGIGIGNLIGFTLCLVQQQWGIIGLPQESYYVPVVPIHLDLFNILLLNLLSIIACYLMLIIPSLIITRINPVKAIRFS